jgi:uncharacterized membrane protein YbhN (UPF0104 family)
MPVELESIGESSLVALPLAAWARYFQTLQRQCAEPGSFWKHAGIPFTTAVVIIVPYEN